MVILTDVCPRRQMSLVLIVFIVPAFAVFSAVCLVFYATFAMPYVRCSRDLRRL
jgi:hypothetical protein